MGDLFSGSPDFEGMNTGYPTMSPMSTIFAGNNPDPSSGGGVLSRYVLNAQPDVQFKGYMDEENSRLGAIPQLNRDPLNQLEQYTQSGQNNPWMQAQLAAQEQNKGQAMGAAKANAASAGASAADQMAARGGLNTGAMQNLARNTANNQKTAGQNVIGQDLATKGQIGQQNAQNQLSVMQNLPGMEVQALQPELQKQSLWQQAAGQNQAQNQALDLANRQYSTGVNQWNIQNQEAGLNAINQANLQNYQTQVAQQAGMEQARAQQNAGKK
jgi:hypothetical protein